MGVSVQMVYLVQLQLIILSLLVEVVLVEVCGCNFRIVSLVQVK